MSPGPGRLDSVTRRRLFLSPLLLLVALLTGLGLNTSSAAASAGPETRVRGFDHVPAISVGEIGSETPGRVGCLRPETGQVMSGSCVATEAVSGFGGLSRAADFGPQSYRALSAELRGTGLQAHHLLEKRFAGVLGQSTDDMLSVAVTQAEHQVFTNAWRQAIPYGAGTSAATPELITATARQVYSGYPEILKALGLAG